MGKQKAIKIPLDPVLWACGKAGLSPQEFFIYVYSDGEDPTDQAVAQGEFYWQEWLINNTISDTVKRFIEAN